MGVAGAAGRLDPLAVEFGGIGSTPQFFERLSAVEVRGAVVGIVGDDGFELADGRLEVAVPGVIEGQTVAGERVLGILFEQSPKSISACTHTYMVAGGE